MGGGGGGRGGREPDAEELAAQGLLTTDQVLELLGIARATLRNWRLAGRIAPIPPRDTYRKWTQNYYRREDVERLLNEGR